MQDIIQILFFVSFLFLGCENVRAQDDSSMTYHHVSAQDTGNNYLENRGEHKYLKKYMLSPEFTCNDGSPAGFYMRKSNYSKLWIVFLEEGWCCFDKESCDERWSRAEYLMSSKEWPETRTVGGILSNSAIENPYWWQANHVFVPYCTSDIWTGRRSQPQHGSRFTFMGSIVIKQVIKELLTKGLANANSLVLSGSSAGGVGVMLNLDPIQKMLRRYSGISVHGITDSGWFLEKPTPNVVFMKRNDSDPSPIEAVTRGIPYWHSQIPSRCRNLYADEPFNCFIGYKIYPTLTVPLFVFQWLFDEFQLKHEVGVPVSRQHWDYIHKMGDRLRKTMLNVTGVFAPSCVSHTVLTKKDWKIIKIDSVSLPQALHCWEMETRLAKINKSKPSRAAGRAGTSAASGRADGRRRPVSSHALLQGGGRGRRNGKSRLNGNRHPSPAFVPISGEKNNHKHKRHQKMHVVCRTQHIQSCTWPQCNKSCPKLQNPITGEVIDFIELLQSFGVNIPSLSSELGIDMESLTHMDEEELINLLTPHK